MTESKCAQLVTLHFILHLPIGILAVLVLHENTKYPRLTLIEY